MLFEMIVFSLFVAAAPESRVGNALTTDLQATQFKATLKEGFHFNDKAPNAVVLDGKTIQPTKFSGREMLFADLPAKWSEGKAVVYMCDDAVTFCEPRTIVLKESGARCIGGNSGDTSVRCAKETTDAQKPKGKINKHGFIEDDYAKAVAIAEKEKKLILIDFAARWCPGCIRMEKEIFDTKEFRKLTKNFVKVKVDTDRFENFVLGEKYSVRAIPAMIVINSKQQEIDRFYDFQPVEFMEGFFGGIQNDPVTLEELKEKAKFKDSAVLLRLGKRLLSAGRAQESVEYLKQIQPPPPEYARARVMAAATLYKEQPDRKGQYIKTLKDAIQSEPNSTRSVEWRTRLVGLIDNEKDKQKLKHEGAALLDQWLASPAKLSEAIKSEASEVGEYNGYERFMVALANAYLLDTPEAWNKAADIGKESDIPANKLGVNMRYIIVLTKAERLEEADKLIWNLLKKNPNDPELQRRRLRVWVGQKKFKEAINLGQNLLSRSYGRNEYYVVEVLAKAYLGADQKQKAKNLLERYLSRNEIEFAGMKDSKKALEELKQKAI